MTNSENIKDVLISEIPKIREMLESQNMKLENVEVVSKSPLEATKDHVEACDGIIIGTTENFGTMAGLIKDFFERIYYPCLESKQGLPFALYIRAGEDGRGTRVSIEKIVTGLRWDFIWFGEDVS